MTESTEPAAFDRLTTPLFKPISLHHLRLLAAVQCVASTL